MTTQVRASVVADTTAPAQRIPVILATLIVILAGFAVASGFALGSVLPLQACVLLFVAITVVGWWGIRINGFSVATRLAVLAYTLPFAVTVGYLVDPGFYWWPTRAAMALMDDPLLIREMITVGIVGLCGLIAGARIAAHVPQLRASHPPAERRTMSLPPFLVVLGLALALSWLSAPKGTVLNRSYADIVDNTVAGAYNLNSAAFVSYILLILACVDAEASPDRSRSVKRVWFTVVLLYIVVVLQLLRGDRESFGMLAALAGLYLTHRTTERVQNKERKRLRAVIVAGLLVVVIYAAVGAVRNNVASARQGSAELSAMLTFASLQSSWTAVLLTNLSMAAEHRSGAMTYLYGQTYADYAMSLTPGVVTQALGLERAIEPTRGPAWWAQGVATGGIHVALVPFKNFGVFGTWLILGCWGFFLGLLELRNPRGGFVWRFLYGTVLSSLVFWFWYSDLYIVRALMGAAMVGLPYAVLSRRPQFSMRQLGWMQA